MISSNFISIQSYYENIIFSLLISLLLLINLVLSTRYLSEKKFFFSKNNVLSESLIFFFLISSISYIFYFIALLGFNLSLLRFIIICLNLILLLFYINNFKTKIFIKDLNNFDYLILFFFLILAFAPTSDADSLDYHLGYPLELLRNEKYLVRDDWFHSKITGIGEFYILFGLIAGSPIFGQIVNFLGLYYFFRFIDGLIKKQKIDNLKARTLIFSTPLLLWFVYSQKIQLLPSVMTPLLFIYLKDTVQKNLKNYSIFLINLTFIFFCKVNFIFISVLIFFFSLKYINNKKKYFFLVFCIGTMLVIPRFYTNYVFFGDIYPPIFEQFKSNPNIEFLDFTKDLGRDRASFKFIFYEYFFFPIKFVINKDLKSSSILLSVFYLFLIYFVINFKHYFKNSLFQFILINTIILLVLPNFQPRYFLETYWFLILLILSNYSLIKNNLFFKLIHYLAKIEFILVIIVLSYFSVFYFSANFGKARYNLIMSNIAQNFKLIYWLGDKIPKNKVVVSNAIRSHALYQNEFISREEYFREDPFEMNKKYKPDYFILTADNELILNEFSRCLLYTGYEKEFYNEARNPFGQKKNKYKVRIYENFCK